MVRRGVLGAGKAFDQHKTIRRRPRRGTYSTSGCPSRAFCLNPLSVQSSARTSTAAGAQTPAGSRILLLDASLQMWRTSSSLSAQAETVSPLDEPQLELPVSAALALRLVHVSAV